jgi:hypothetical protein
VQDAGAVKRILGVARIYGGDAVLIDQHLDRRAKAGGRNLAVQQGQRLARPPVAAGSQRRNQQNQKQTK